MSSRNLLSSSGQSFAHFCGLETYAQMCTLLAHALYPHRCKHMSTLITHTDPSTYMNTGARCMDIQHTEEIQPNVGTHAHTWTLIHMNTGTQMRHTYVYIVMEVHACITHARIAHRQDHIHEPCLTHRCIHIQHRTLMHTCRCMQTHMQTKIHTSLCGPWLMCLE